MFRKLLIFEYKKNIKRKKNIIIFFLLLLLTICFFLLNNWMKNEIEATEVVSYELRISSIEDGINRLPDDINQAKEVRENLLTELELTKKLLQASKESDWRAELRSNIELDSFILDNLLTGKAVGGEPIPVLKERIELNNQLLEKDIEPINEMYPTQGLYFLKRFLNTLFSMLGIVFLLFMFGDILSTEFDKRSINFLFTQPITKGAILHSKFIVAFTSAIIVIVIISIFSLLIGTAFGGGLGSINYPIPIYTSGTDELNFISLIYFLCKMVTLFLFVLTFIIVLVNLITILTKNSLLSISTTLIISAVFFIGIVKYKFFYQIATFVPFTYFDVAGVINGSTSIQLETNSINFGTGIIILTLYSLILYVISAILINRIELKNE